MIPSWATCLVCCSLNDTKKRRYTPVKSRSMSAYPKSVALDLMEELRPCMADRFVLTIINNRMIRPEDFQTQDSGAVLLTEEGRKKFLKAWQERKRDTLTHPYLNEKLSWGMIPYIQALLLVRYLRGDLDGYPPFLWK